MPTNADTVVFASPQYKRACTWMQRKQGPEAEYWIRHSGGASQATAELNTGLGYVNGLISTGAGIQIDHSGHAAPKLCHYLVALGSRHSLSKKKRHYQSTEL